jgi:hypothetical protein
MYLTVDSANGMPRLPQKSAVKIPHKEVCPYNYILIESGGGDRLTD